MSIQPSYPISCGSFPLTMDEFSLHDPCVLADKRTGMYYLYNANYGQYASSDFGNGRCVVMYSSPDLVHFSEPVNVFDGNTVADTAWYDNSDSPWAPEVHEWRGKYWMFVTMHAKRHDGARPANGPAWFRDRNLLDARRGMVVAVSEMPQGPFHVMHENMPVTPVDSMALDGTLAVDASGKPWMVFAHEWVQIFDGSMEAIQLDPEDLSVAVSDPCHLWFASEGGWHIADGDAPVGGWGGNFATDIAKHVLSPEISGYVTDGPWVMSTPSGALVCLWTSYSKGEYILAQAISETGAMTGPWKQLAPINYDDAGHAMVFQTFEGDLLLIMHTNMTRKDSQGRPLVSHGIVYEVSLGEDGFTLGRHRSDIDGLKEAS